MQYQGIRISELLCSGALTGNRLGLQLLISKDFNLVIMNANPGYMSVIQYIGALN